LPSTLLAERVKKLNKKIMSSVTVVDNRVVLHTLHTCLYVT